MKACKKNVWGGEPYYLLPTTTLLATLLATASWTTSPTFAILLLAVSLVFGSLHAFLLSHTEEFDLHLPNLVVLLIE